MKKLLKNQWIVVLLNSIGERYKNLKNALEYGITEIIINALRNRIESKENEDGES